MGSGVVTAPSGSAASPLTELNYLLSRWEQRIERVREAQQRQREQPPPSPASTSRPLLGRFGFGRKAPVTPTSEHTGDSSELTSLPMETPVVSPLQDVVPSTRGTTHVAQFIDLPDADDCVEDLRRLAELVVIGENFVTTLQKKKDTLRSKEGWGGDVFEDLSEREREMEIAEEDDRLQLFDTFFEREALELIVTLLMGRAFHSTRQDIQPDVDANESNDDSIEHDSSLAVPPDPSDEVWLPSLYIATQAIQSISILIQNVSRATSLYVILSNNHVNTLINFPLDLYAEAEQGRQHDAIRDGTLTHMFKSPELAELTTHLVTLLKSLAMRMNAETLQFFLKYPTEHLVDSHAGPASSSHFEPTIGSVDSVEDDDDNEKQGSEGLPTYRVEFPLYERALEFCAGHHDSFVRVTAMNICLNTLQLTTVSPKEDAGEETMDSVKSPDGVLHNSKALPFRERLAIAQHACTPSRVERLVAPIFGKLAERWNSLEEHIREMDTHKNRMGAHDGRNEKMAQAREKTRRERLLRGFQEKADSLQDELLLLEDVFKVGLTVLNEQTIEMMLATFVYPLLLQPLLLYYQRFDGAVDPGRNDKIEHPFSGYGGDFSHAETTLAAVSSPAKTALFTLASVFHFMTNPPLLRLVFAALFHPLSPDSSTVPTVRSNLEVAGQGSNHQWTIRLDMKRTSDGPLSDDRTTYDFGTKPSNRRIARSEMPTLDKIEESEECIFVLSPALAEVLEFRGGDDALMERTRPNPYRKSLLECLNVPYEMDEVRQLAVCAFDVALSVFDPRFTSDIVFGTDVNTNNKIVLEDHTLDAEQAQPDNDKGICGSGTDRSCHSSPIKERLIGVNPIGEVVTALCGSAIFAPKDNFGGFNIEFDSVAAHALINCVRRNDTAMRMSAKLVETRRRQSSVFIAHQVTNLQEMTVGGATLFLSGSPAADDPNFEEQMRGRITNLLFFESMDEPVKLPAVEGFVELQGSSTKGDKEFSLLISSASTFKDMCGRVGNYLLSELDNGDNHYDQQVLEGCQASARALFHIDAFSAFLKALATNGGASIYHAAPHGLAISASGGSVDISDSCILEMKRQIFAPLSANILSAIFFSENEIPNLPIPGSIISLVGSLAIPCVCEIPASMSHLFLQNGSMIISEGVTWQSLYLAFQHNSLVFAQPQPDGEAGNGRAVSSCLLERLSVVVDQSPDPSSPARRLILSYKSFDSDPPPLFLFDELPKRAKYGPFSRIEPFTSTLDVWFEDQRATEQAFQIFMQTIFAAKAQGGLAIFQFLSS